MPTEKLNWKKLLFLSGAAFIAPTMAQVAQCTGGAPCPGLDGHTVVAAGISSLVTALYALFSNPRHRG
jgi:hypothetical protein